jgi:hypothetical protein
VLLHGVRVGVRHDSDRLRLLPRHHQFPLRQRRGSLRQRRHLLQLYDLQLHRDVVHLLQAHG